MTEQELKKHRQPMPFKALEKKNTGIFDQSPRNRMFYDHLMLAFFVEVLLPGDEHIEADLILPDYTYGVARVGDRLSKRKLRELNAAIDEGRRVDFRSLPELMEWTKRRLGVSDCQCVIALQQIHWELPYYRHNRRKNT